MLATIVRRTIVSLALILAAVICTLSPMAQPWTPGPIQTQASYDTRRVGPIPDRDEAIRRAVAVDNEATVRAQPLTVEMLDARPDRVLVEFYATHTQAADLYGGGHYGDPVAESQAVWIVIIRGRASISFPGYHGPVKGGVMYMFSQESGNLLMVAAAALRKRSGGSP